MPQPADEEEATTLLNSYRPLGIPLSAKPVNVSDHPDSSQILCVRPLLGPLLFDNTDSDCRDHCANERTFLSYLRLALFMSVVSIAIIVSFHLKSQPSRLELRMAKPLGVIFWALSVACLCLGFGNYVKTVNKYSRRMAIVQSGWKTQTILSIVAMTIVGVCVLFLATNSKRY